MTGRAAMDPAFVLLGADSLMASILAVNDETAGVREARDPERIHRMRVASRRLRGRLQAFRKILPDRKAGRWRREIRGLTRALGAARDLDVQLAFLEEFKGALAEKNPREGVARLDLRLRQKRDREQDRVLKALDRLAARGTLDELSQTLRGLRIAAQLRCGDSTDVEPEGTEPAFAALSPLIQDLLSYEIYLKDRSCVAELHQMRIAAKRLRYAMEIFEPWLPNLLPGTIKRVKELQETLGDIHDCDVWTELIPVFLEEERERTINFYGSARGMGRLRQGLDQLREDRAAFRERRRGELNEQWSKTIRSKNWRDLIRETFPGKPAASGKPESGAAESSGDGDGAS